MDETAGEDFAEPRRPAGEPAPLRRHRWALNHCTLGSVYDHVVAGWSVQNLWGVDPARLDHLYHRLGGVHVEVGARTPRFFAHGLAAAPAGALSGAHLVEADPIAAAKARRRVRRHNIGVHVHHVDPREPWPIADGTADTVVYVLGLHALPGPGYDAKVDVLLNAARVLRPGGRFSGCAVLGEADPGAHTVARGVRMRQVYNHLGLFDNDRDVARRLKHLLSWSFGHHAQVHVRVEGMMVLWEVTAA